MAFCTSCGTALVPGSQFCIHCGAAHTSRRDYAEHSATTAQQSSAPVTASPQPAQGQVVPDHPSLFPEAEPSKVAYPNTGAAEPTAALPSVAPSQSAPLTAPPGAAGWLPTPPAPHPSDLWPTADLHQPPPGTRRHWIVGLVVILVLISGGTAWVLAHRGPAASQPTPAAIATSSATTTPPRSQTPTTTRTTPTTPPTRTTSPPAGTTPAPPANGQWSAAYQSIRIPISGADWQGFVADLGARCNANDPAMVIAANATSRVAVCLTVDHRYYYRGSRISDGVALELEDPTPTTNGFLAFNHGTTYEVSPFGLVITSTSGEITPTSWTEYWASATN